MNYGNIAGRIFELMQNPDIMISLEEHFKGYTGAFDINTEYTCTEYVDSVRYSGNKDASIAYVALYIARNNYEYLKDMKALAGLSRDDVTILSAIIVSKEIEHVENKYGAYINGEGYEDDPVKVDYYGTKVRAFNKGFDHFMEKNSSSGYRYLNYILELVEEELRNTPTK